VSVRPRILVVEGATPAAADLLQRCEVEGDLVRVSSPARALALLRAERFDAVFADGHDRSLWARVGELVQAEGILEAIPDAVAVVDPAHRVLWANAAFDRWCGGPTEGRNFYDALGSPGLQSPAVCPLKTALAGLGVLSRLHCRDGRYLDLQVTPVYDPDQKITQLICLGRDVTGEVVQQNKLDALHKAGRELAGLAPEQIAEMGLEERIEVLKLNIRRFTHDLLHYDVIEVRLLDPQTGRLEPLLQEGMTAAAAGRDLYAKAEGNGITGYVAATGKSYLCPDTTADPLYVEGSPGARSSLTVPLLVGDKVIGTFNVESPTANAFGEDDLQFAEIFSREIASVLNTLELLTAEKRSTASQSIAAISREVALPVDEILAAATAVLDRYIGHDAEIADKLKRILAGARSIKQSIQKVGEDLTPPDPRGPAPAESGHPHLRGLRVLVADSDERVRRSAHGLLGRFGCVVETARDGREALTMARLSTYDAILADIRLPDVDGYEVYRRLRECQPQAKVVLMTSYGYDPSHALVKARQDGLRFVLFKPFRMDQLLDALASPAESPDGRVGVASGPA
jgi:two-component system, sensor histidine kinase SagS